MLGPQTIRITGASTTVRVSAVSHGAKQVDLKAGADNAGTVRFGGSDTSATVGAPLVAGESYDFGPVGLSTPALPDSNRWELSQIFVYVATGDILDVVYGG